MSSLPDDDGPIIQSFFEVVVIAIGGSRMEDLGIGEELDVADFKDHVQRETEAGLFEDRDGFFLLGGEGRDEAFGGEASERAEEVWVEFAVDAAWGRGGGVRGLEVEE